MKYDFEIIGEIGYGYGSSEYVAWMLEGMQGREVNIRVNSLGGNAVAGLDIATRLKEHGNCTVHLMGMNASAATILAMGAKKVCMDSNGGMLIHKCMIWYEEWGNMNADDLRQAIEEMTKTANQADSYDAIALKWYMNRAKKSADEVLGLMRENKFITADEALEWGFVDEIENCADAVPTAQARALAWVAQADKALLHAPIAKHDDDNDAPSATMTAKTTNTINNDMIKTYTAIAALAGIEAPYQAVADKDGNVGCYVAEAQLDVLEVAAAKAQADAEALAKANIDLATANAAMEQMKTEHETALAALREEMNAALEAKVAELNTAAEEAKAALETEHAAAMEAVKAEHTAALEAANAEHATALEAANTEHTTALSAKDAELATAQADLTAANEKVTALEAQVAEMAAAAPEPQVPAVAGAQAETKKNYAEMSTAEKAAYMKAQMGK